VRYLSFIAALLACLVLADVAAAQCPGGVCRPGVGRVLGKRFLPLPGRGRRIARRAFG